MNIITKISLITSIFLFVSSCLNIESYPIEPAIVFSKYTLTDTTDALGNNIKLFELTIEFTDGDGDIGLKESDTIAPFNPTSIYYYNLWVTPFKKENTIYTEMQTAIPFHARIPNLTPTGQNKSLNGEISYEVNITDIITDTLKFKIQLIDRALHESNVVDSPDIAI